ncbi:hypothetical protein D3C85_1170250 [compost metagenome]
MQQVGWRTHVGDLGRGRDRRGRRELRAIGARRLTQHHVKRVHGGIKPCLQRRNRRLHLRQRSLGLPQLKLGGQSFLEKQAYFVHERLTRRDLVPCDIQPSLQAPDRDIGVGRLCGDDQARGDRGGLRRLIVGQPGLPAPPQATKHVQFPTRLDIGFVDVAPAVVARRGIQHLPQRRLDRLMRTPRRSADARGRQKRGVGGAQPGAGLGHAGSGLSQVQILCKRQRHVAGEQRIVEVLPPRRKRERRRRLRRIGGHLAQEARRQRGVGPVVVGPYRATGHQAGA